MSENEIQLEELQAQYLIAKAFSRVNFGADGEAFREAMTMMRNELVEALVYECDGNNERKDQVTGMIRNMDQIIEHVAEAPDMMAALEREIRQLEKSNRNTEVGSD